MIKVNMPEAAAIHEYREREEKLSKLWREDEMEQSAVASMQHT